MKAAKNVLTSYIKLYLVMFRLNSNQPIKVAHLQKLANQAVLNGALVIEMETIPSVKARKTLVVW